MFATLKTIYLLLRALLKEEEVNLIRIYFRPFF